MAINLHFRPFFFIPPTAAPVLDERDLIDYLEAGDRVWVEFAPEWDSWDGKPTFRPGELVFTDVAPQQGFVVYWNAHNLISQGWFEVGRVYRRAQRMSFDRPDALEMEAAHSAHAEYAAL